MKITGTTYLEIKIDLTGTYVPGCKAWGGSPSEPAINPPEDPSVEDLEIEGLSAPPCGMRTGQHFPIAANLLDGVNLASPDVQRLLSNILAVIHDDAVVHMIEGVE